MRNILVCVDFSDVTPKVTERAKGLAKAFGARLHLLHVVPQDDSYVAYSPGGIPPMTPAVATDLRVEQEKLARVALGLQVDDIPTSYEVLEGMPISDILGEARRVEADLIIMGSHGHSAIYELLVGSVTEGVLRRATMPVMVVSSRCDSETK